WEGRPLVWEVLTIFVAQVIYVSTLTVRWIILLRGSRWLAAAISVGEVMIYVYALGLVVTNLDQPIKLVVYAVGYATGSLLGTFIEERLAFGHVVLQVITPSGSAAVRT